MIAHVVLFRPQEELTPTAQTALAAAFVAAMKAIPSVRAARVGRRVTHGRAYEQTMRDYPFGVILEFDDLAGLTAYLEHPSHQALGEHFSTSMADALVYDFDLRDARDDLDSVLNS